MNKRILNCLPVVCWYGFICLLSSIPGKTIVSMVPRESYQFWCHRIAHFVEYGVLGVLVIRACVMEGLKITILIILSLACLVFLSGALDEWHQSFVPGRTPQSIDAVFDTICGTVGMILYKICFLW